MRKLQILTLFVLLNNLLLAQTSIELKQIMQGQTFVGSWPEMPNWTVDGASVVFDWNPQNAHPGNTPHAFSLAKKTIAELDINQADKTVYWDATQTNCNIQYYANDGQLLAYNKGKKTTTLLFESTTSIWNIQRLEDQNKVAFQLGDNLFLYNAKVGSFIQLTQFVKGEKPSKSNAKKTYLESQEAQLFDYWKNKNIKSDFYDKRNKLRIENTNLSPIYFGDMRVENIVISPDGKKITYRLMQDTQEKDTETEFFITKNGFAATRPARTKVSQNEPASFLYVLHVGTDSVTAVSVDNLPGIFTQGLFMNTTEKLKASKNVIFHGPYYHPNNNTGVLEIKSFDNKDRWIVALNPTTLTLELLDHQHEESWIGGPCISGWNEEAGVLNWIDSTQIYYVSEKTGWAQLYSYHFKSKKTEALTTGAFEIHQIQRSKKEGILYLTTNQSHLGNRSFYHLNTKTKTLLPIITLDGNAEVAISPNEDKLALRFSTKNKPWEIYVQENKPNQKMVKVTQSTTKMFDAIKWADPKVIVFKGLEGVAVQARVYEPQSNVKNGAAIIFVHGAGYLQNAHNWWSHYYREYMFHNLLIQQGYTVLDIDYRASEGYGMKHRTDIYRHMGGKDLDDHIAGKNHLVALYGIDPKRLGIYGGSYGGFITLMALLTTPDEFACGAALRSVTDFTHYNHEYTSNILNAPETDSMAYQRSSPIYFAQNLNKPLLMLHGMVDDNVQYQDIVRLSQRFIELGKENWELASFPVEAHAFTEPSSWYDEYRRILEHMNKHLLKK